MADQNSLCFQMKLKPNRTVIPSSFLMKRSKCGWERQTENEPLQPGKPHWGTGRPVGSAAVVGLGHCFARLRRRRAEQRLLLHQWVCFSGKVCSGTFVCQTYKARRQRGQVQQLLVLLKGEKLRREEKEKRAVVTFRR